MSARGKPKSSYAFPSPPGAPTRRLWAIRDESLAVVPATLDEEPLLEQMKAADSIAVVKVGRHLAKLKRVLDRLGLTAQARYVEFAATGAERVRALGDVGQADSAYFAVVLVRKTEAFP